MDKGNTVLTIDQNPARIKIADHFINTDPQGGSAFLYEGILKRCWMQNSFFIAKYLKEEFAKN